MTKDDVKDILDRVLTWPVERQEDVARVIELMEEQDTSAVALTDEQAAEIQRRLAEDHPQTLTLAAFVDRLRQRYGI
ncbi:MAG TPA: hypothetical protein VGP48_03325 [Stellaceae bacterium]|nr:hypothetical protein [Stellaceae bacterium]